MRKTIYRSIYNHDKHTFYCETNFKRFLNKLKGAERIVREINQGYPPQTTFIYHLVPHSVTLKYYVCRGQSFKAAITLTGRENEIGEVEKIILKEEKRFSEKLK